MRKYKRKIIVDEQQYIWTLEGNNLFLATDWIVVTLVGTSYSRLYINPFVHDFEIMPKNIVLAIKMAKKLGWNPNGNSGDIWIEYRNGSFKQMENTNEAWGHIWFAPRCKEKVRS